MKEHGEAKPAISIAGKSVGRKSQCEPLAEAIMAKVEVGLSAQRIYQDLVEESGFTDSYQSVKRFVRKLRSIQPERVWRLECQPGEELQLDFGLGAPIDDAQGKTRRSWVMRLVLSYSRKGYSEAVSRQDTETFLRCLENVRSAFAAAAVPAEPMIPIARNTSPIPNNIWPAPRNIARFKNKNPIPPARRKMPE